MEVGLNRTPLHNEHLALGARMVPFAGYEMPVQYAGIMEEHRAVRSTAGVFDVSHMAQFRVFGFEAEDALQALLTNDVTKLEMGDAQYTLLCDEDGGVLDDLIVYRSGDAEYLIVANASNRAADFAWIEERLPEGIEFVDESDRTAMIALQGPLALSILGELAGVGYEPPSRFTIAGAMVDTVPALVARTGYTGEDGVEMICRADDAPSLWRALLSFPEVMPCGLGARDTLRLEMGYHLYGHELARDIDPITAGLAWVVSRTKGEFIGSESIERIRKEGPPSCFVGLMTDAGIPREGHRVLHEGVEVGKVASGTFSPTLERGIATARIESRWASPGTTLEVEIRSRIVSATVVQPPFVSHTSLSKP